MKVMKRYCDYDYDNNCIILFDASDAQEEDMELAITWISSGQHNDLKSATIKKQELKLKDKQQQKLKTKTDDDYKITDKDERKLPLIEHIEIVYQKKMKVRQEKLLKAQRKQLLKSNPAFVGAINNNNNFYAQNQLPAMNGYPVHPYTNQHYQQNNHNNNNNNHNNNNNNVGVLSAEMIRDGILLKLELCIAGWKNSNRGFCAFYLTIPRGHELSPRLTARYTVSCQNITKQSSIRDDFHLGVGFPNFCTESLFTQNVKDIQLSVQIEIFTTKSRTRSIENVIHDQFVQQFGVSLCRKSEDIQSALLQKIYQVGNDSDIIIRCRDKNNELQTIEVHKCVLTHCSTVFARMFDCNRCGFIETQTNTINLENALWKHLIIKAMVEFLYFGEIPGEICSNIEALFELFRIAEYFEIQALITECCHQFISTLTPNTVCYLLLQLVTCDGFEYQHIQQIAFIKKHDILWRYMVKNIKEIQSTASYKQILYKKPIIIDQLITKMT